MNKKHPHKQVKVRKHSNASVWLLLVISFIICSYWVSGLFINSYRYPSVAAAYQILWLPMLMCFCCLPVYLLVHLNKAKFKLDSVYWIPVVMMLISGMMLLIYK